MAPPPARPILSEPVPFQVNLLAETDAERHQRARLEESFAVLMRTPTLCQGVLMPDACEAGHVGTIPVGGVAVAKGAIHPGMHSADICCSMFVSAVEGLDPKDLLDTLHRITHFGPGGRQDQRFTLPANLRARMEANSFLNNPRILLAAQTHLGTVGDVYWDALQIVRDWTYLNHKVLHDAAIDELGGKVVDRFWNEHNFVFREHDLFYHAKGATPIHRSFLPDSDGRMIVPLNLVDPILIIEGKRTSTNLGFAPHGAGRYVSRRGHKRSRLAAGQDENAIFEEESRLAV